VIWDWAALGVVFGSLILGALYGLHRHGGVEGAAVGFLCALVLLPVFLWPVLPLQRWLLEPRKPLSWFDRLYWIPIVSIWAAILVAYTFGAFELGFFQVREPGFDGYMDKAIVGVFLADGFVLFVNLGLFVVRRLHAWLVWLRGPEVAEESARRSKLQGALAPTLAELEAVRLEVGRRIRRRAAWMTPLGAGALLAAWAIYAWPRPLGFDLILAPLAFLIGSAVGQGVAISEPEAEYDRLYKARVLSQLAALFGALTYQRPSPADLPRLREFHVFRRFDFARADDAIVGCYNGLEISILQLQLFQGWAFLSRRVFRGLFVQVELKNRLTGTTVITADAGALGNFLDRLGASDIQRVGLESSEFEREFEVYATDQVMARALLTPAFIERFRALGADGFGQPLAVAKDAQLLIAMPRLGGENGPSPFFSPPSFANPAADNAFLQRLHHEIETVLQIADSVIALDDATSQATNARRPSVEYRRQPERPDVGFVVMAGLLTVPLSVMLLVGISAIFMDREGRGVGFMVALISAALIWAIWAFALWSRTPRPKNVDHPPARSRSTGGSRGRGVDAGGAP
jgi:hypothetical protein